MGEDDFSVIDEGSSESSGSDDRSAGSVNFARQDIKLMNVVRAIVILFLLCAGFLGSEVVFILAYIAQENEYARTYTLQAEALADSFQVDMNNKLRVAHGLVDQFYASSKTETWPFVFFDDFQQRCESPALVSRASSIRLAPLVVDGEREAWETFVAERYLQQDAVGQIAPEAEGGAYYYATYRDPDYGIYRFIREDERFVVALKQPSDDAYFPVGQQSPFMGSNETGVVGTLFNLWSNTVRGHALDQMVERKGPVVSSFLYQHTNDNDMASYKSPRSSILFPLFLEKNETGLLAALDMEFKWETTLLEGINELPFVVVIENACGGNFSYTVTKESTSFMGPGNLRSPELMDLSIVQDPVSTSYEDFAQLFDEQGGKPIDPETGCNVRISIYPSEEYEALFFTSRPDVYRAVFLFASFLMVMVFVSYDCMVEWRQAKVVKAAQRSDAIVRSFFPEAVRNQLYEDAIKKEEEQKIRKRGGKKDDWRQKHSSSSLAEAPKSQLKRFVLQDREGSGVSDSMSMDGSIGSNDTSHDMRHTAPIADLYPDVTVLFADIAGFTSWSSEREPTQVFILLETIYRALDKAAKKMGVFKVETIGDCYVAATGLPDPRADHAIVMARFARKALVRMNHLTKLLEAQLGPGTAELTFRIGMHSGPVTAGVLRGQKCRFQLFGDTMNMAARMEQTGTRNKIQVSADTAKLLIEGGQQQLLSPRENAIAVKGKGECETFWLSVTSLSHSQDASSQRSGDSSELDDSLPAAITLLSSDQRLGGIWAGTSLANVLGQTQVDDKLERLVGWNTDVLRSLLERVVAARQNKRNASTSDRSYETSLDGTPMDSVQMAISLPDYDEQVGLNVEQVKTQLSREANQELHDYVAAICKFGLLPRLGLFCCCSQWPFLGFSVWV
jgi:class 3 adenylate cyclase